ncbi:MAG: phage holin family protein [Helcococcus sp.]|nr:phage holin family protein [Helcococcus sp.]
MKTIWNFIQAIFSLIRAFFGYFLGGFDGLVIALITLAIIDYITGVMLAILEKNLSSSIGFKGIFRKILMFMLIAVAHIMDTQIIGTGSALRTAIVFFYLSNEGISIFENAALLGLPVPEKLKLVLKQIKENEGEKRSSKDSKSNFVKIILNTTII